MALRRALCSLQQSLQRFAIAEGLPAAANSAQQQQAGLTLTSLRSFRALSAQGREGGVAAAQGSRPWARGFAATPAARQQAAAAPAAGGQEEEESLEQIRARIFGTHIGNGLRSGRKVLRRPLVGAKVLAYYPEDPLKTDPLMPNFAAEEAKLRLDRMRRRGKAPPKKGAGKRAGKKK